MYFFITFPPPYVNKMQTDKQPLLRSVQNAAEKNAESLSKIAYLHGIMSLLCAPSQFLQKVGSYTQLLCACIIVKQLTALGF